MELFRRDMESISIILLGNKHCGKSTVGKIISETRRIPFFDLDDLIFGKLSKQYVSIRDFCQKEGMLAFRKKEMQTVTDFINEMKNKSYVLALGGGTAQNNNTVNLLKQTGILIYLNAEEAILYERIKKGGIPPFLKKEKPQEDFHQLFEKRNTSYHAIADIIIETSGKNQEEVAAAITETIQNNR